MVPSWFRTSAASETVCRLLDSTECQIVQKAWRWILGKEILYEFLLE